MKKIHLLLLFFIAVLTANLIVSCEKPEKDKIKTEINLDQILSKYNAGKMPDFEAKKYAGDITLQRISQQKLGIFMLNSPDKRFFLLQYDQPQNFENAILYNAEILWLRENLVIFHEGSILVFAIHPTTDVLQGINVSKKYRGFGLGMHTNPLYYDEIMALAATHIERDGELDPITEASCQCKPKGSGASLKCTSGGTGASSCSISDGNKSCSVSCSGTDEACCD